MGGTIGGVGAPRNRAVRSASLDSAEPPRDSFAAICRHFRWPEDALYLKPRTLAEAAAAAAEGGFLLAGATDVFPAHVTKPMPNRIVDLSHVAEMRGIEFRDSAIRIGGATRWSEIVNAELPPALACLRQAAREVGSLQIQNRGTVAGNLCNASPAADGVPPLLALDAEVELASVSGIRRLALSHFITGYRATALRSGEILSAVSIPRGVEQAASAFLKLGARKYLVISIVMAAAVLPRDGRGRIADARVAVGAASAVACRLPGLEQALQGLRAGERPSRHVAMEHLRALSPIDDVRATAAYRSDAARTIVGQALDRAAGFARDD